MENKSNNILIEQFADLDYGFLTATKVVGSTMASNGKLSLLDRNNELPIVSRDGVSVIKNIRFAQKTQNFGSLIAIAGCTTTLSLAGDGTSCTAVMMGAYLENITRKEFNKTVEKGMRLAVDEVKEHLNTLSKKATKEDLKHIATVASNNDPIIAEIIVDAFNYSGKDGVVEVVIDNTKLKTEFIKRDGLRIDGHGSASPFFFNREDKKMSYEGEDVAIMVAFGWDYNPFIINKVQDFYNSVGGIRSTPLTIFLEKPNSDMTDKLIGIKQVGFNINVVYANSYDEFESETLLNDIAQFTGASPYNPRNPEKGIKFGVADKVVSTVEDTTLVVFDVPQPFKDTLRDLQKAEVKDERRIKRLTTKASVISVGGFNPMESKETFDRIDDAVFSYKTATKEGIISGGGSTLCYINGLMQTKFDNKDKQKGYDLVKTVMLSPSMQILKNSNRVQSYKKNNIFTKIFNKSPHFDYITPAKENYGVGFNSAEDKMSNLLEDGIIDSKLSIRVAIESSLTVGIQMLSLGSILHFPENQYLD